jgi:hypothetical protein
LNLDFVVPWLIAGGLLYLLRQLERWMHQHIFKVGWLLTKNFQTTTILYYTFFLPGVILHEIVYWLAAGVMNVRADRAIGFPEKQEVAELRLNFVKLSKKASKLRVAIISTVPLAVGIGVVLLIARDIVHINNFLTILAEGDINTTTVAFSTLTSAPDFWLWVYLMFAIGNTMMPNAKDLQGWGWVIVIVIAALVGLVILGAGEIVVQNVLLGPVATALNTLSSIFAVLIGIDFFMVLALGTVESIIERITGNSATFKDGKLIAMTRAEMLAQREQQLKRERQASKKTPALASGSPSIYTVQLPIPGAPGKEPVTQPATVVLGTGASPSPTLRERPTPAVITPNKPPSPPSFASPTAPRLPSVIQPADDEENDDDEEDDYDDDES